MNKSKAVKAAIAFKRGMAFVRGMQQLAQDADVPEGARWITIGAHKNEDGESSGGRHVLIDKESGTILKGLSKDVQGKRRRTIRYSTPCRVKSSLTCLGAPVGMS